MALEPIDTQAPHRHPSQYSADGGATLDEALECYERDHSYRILLVDDEASILQSLLRTFRGSNYFIDCFQSPLEALASAKHNAYQVIIADQRMPQMSGLELLDELQYIQPEAVNIVLSGLNDSATLLQAINSSAVFRYLLKPWDNNELMKAVDAAIKLYDERVETQRLADSARVNNGSMTKHRAYLRELESKYPGITHVERNENGAIILRPKHSSAEEYNQAHLVNNHRAEKPS